ncbi:Organic cation transporter [Operophtera brumata]|uniref:Organic cation transporter n=1 Tax=Operophtera brumata TaxID=104452 RepID=A0A0L7LL76_OPEBR|nr:Organic cation transporter [Operophtera brumata]
MAHDGPRQAIAIVLWYTMADDWPSWHAIGKLSLSSYMMEMENPKDDNGSKSPNMPNMIQDITGAFGKYQLFLCLTIFISKIFIAFHQMAIIFLAPKVSYTCGLEKIEVCPCAEPNYDTSIFTRTIIMEWDLICDRKWLTSLTQALFQFVGGTMVIGFVIVMEFMGSQHRELASALYQVPFNIGHMLLPTIAYFLRDYTEFQLAISAPAAIMLLYFVTVPETPRWLIAVNRTDEAIKVLERVAKATLSSNQLKKGSILDLFRTPNIRKNILCMSFNWLACSYCFYGVSQFVGQLSGDVFSNVAASAGVTLLGTFSSIPLLKTIGRRTIVIVFNFIAAVCLFMLALVPAGLASIVLACVGVVSSFIIFVVVYLYCSELFPTVVRNAAIGVSSMSARVGSMLAPFVIDLQGVAPWLPPLVFAIVPLIAGGITFLLPETKGCELMTTIEEGENFGKKGK